MDYEIDHLGIALRSLEEGLSFYVDQLGIAPGASERVESEGVNVVMLPSSNGSRIELLEGVSPESAITKFIDNHGPGLHHIALKVDVLDETVARLKERGATLLNEPRIGAGGHRYVFVHPRSTGGVLLELIQK